MTKLLSQEQVNQYNNSGFVSPVDALNQDEIKQSITEIESFEEETGQPQYLYKFIQSFKF